MSAKFKSVKNAKGLKVDFSTGIDAYRFILSKSSFLKFMKKIELNTKLRNINRNKAITTYVKEKYKKDKPDEPLLLPDDVKYKIRYVSFKRGVTSLTNSMIVIENSNELNDLCKKRKKPYGYYIKVVFAGLYQPSREVFKETYKVLSKFLRRFKPYEFDIAHDFKCDEQAGSSSKEWFAKRFTRFGGKFISYKTTIYENECYERFYGLKKICFYDKFEKQTNYHHQKLDESLKGWHRLELTFKLKDKFIDHAEYDRLAEYVAVMDEMINRLTGNAYPYGVDIGVLGEQVAFIKDNRRHLSFTKSA